MDLNFFLEELFGASVDLVLQNTIKPGMRERIPEEVAISRDHRVFLGDIIEAVGHIREYTDGFSLEDFTRDRKIRDAVVRNLEIIGEAVKNIPQEER